MCIITTTWRRNERESWQRASMACDDKRCRGDWGGGDERRVLSAG
jgi:hypothetical protein